MRAVALPDPTATAGTDAPPNGAAGGAPSPAVAATATPQQPKGEQASADASVQVALRMLERALVAHGAESEKGRAITRAIISITKAFGHDEDKAQSLLPAEVRSALLAPGGPMGGPQTPNKTGAAPGGQPPAAAAPPEDAAQAA